MKFRELLQTIQEVASRNNIEQLWLVGGIPRSLAISKIFGIPLEKNSIQDIDLTTGDDSVKLLSKETAIEFNKHFNIKVKQGDDGHTSIHMGQTKVDFSSNALVPNIDKLLIKQGFNNPTNLQKEAFSRDFTINSLLQSLDLKIIKDPTKQGVGDIKKKLIKTCLDPNITLSFNTNRIIRILYLAAKLGFDVDNSVIEWVAQNPQMLKQSKPGYILNLLNKAMVFDADRTKFLIKQMNLEGILSQTKTAQTRPTFWRKNFDYGAVDDEKENDLLYKPNERQKRHIIDEKRNWLVDINPFIFLLLTCHDTDYPTVENINPKSIDVYQNSSNTRVHPYLKIDINTGKVMGHEGRHRAAAVRKAGGKWYRVGIQFVKEGFIDSRNYRSENMPRIWRAEFTAYKFNIDELITEGRLRIINDSVQKEYWRDVNKADDQNSLLPEMIQKFHQLAELQRGTPERAMEIATAYMGGGVLATMVEHIGDLIHRMADNVDLPSAGYGAVKEKVDRAIRFLENGYLMNNFDEEMRVNFKNNAEFKGISVDEYINKLKQYLEKYVAAHKALPTYNKAQKYANNAAIAIGEIKPQEALMWVYKLKDMLKSPEEWIKYAREYAPLKSIAQLGKFGYFSGNENYNDTYGPFNDYYYAGANIDNEDYYAGYNPRLGDRQRDGKEFDEFEEFRKKRKRRIRDLKRKRLLLELLNDKDFQPQKNVFEPHPFYENMYGSLTGIEGLWSEPFSFSGNIADGANYNMNPWNTVYQTTNASNQQIKSIIRQSILRDRIK